MSQSSVIGRGTVVRGNVEGEGPIEILGRVDGDVTTTGDVQVGEEGAVLGNISGTRISVQGAVQGNLRGSEAILLERGARIVGDLSAPRIGIGPGALVRGSVRTEGEPSLGANKRPAAGGFKQAAFVAKPVAKVEPKAAPPPPARRDDDDDDEEPRAVAMAQAPRPKEKEVERRPPPPVLPSLGKGAKGKKKKDRD
jgi:cytoskeletal protein CcmA (bactofilin family)